MDRMTKYQASIEYCKKELGLDEYTSLYDIVNRLCDGYITLKDNQTKKEPEDGIPTERKRGRPRKEAS
jgi:hypothetical protein